MNRCWLAGSLGDALHGVLCAAGYNLRWLLGAIARGRIGRLFRPWPGSAADDAQRVGGAVIDEEGLCPCNRCTEAEVCRAELNFAERTTENLNSER